MLIVNAVWIWVNRHGGGVTIDEAGYLSYSFADYHAWQAGGLTDVIGTAIHEQVQPPLVPLLTAAVYAVIGRASVMAAFGVELLAYGSILLVTYSIAKGLAGKAAGLVAAIAIASAPIMLDYSHLYMYAVPAAAFASLTVWAALRSQQMTRLGWSVVWGIALGAMLVSRTVTIAFAPAFVLLALLEVAVSTERLRSAIGLACGTVAAAIVAGPWWIVSGSGAWAYLTSFGYGAQSAGYGPSRTLFSWSSWVSFLQQNVDLYIWIPLGAILVLGAAALAVKLLLALGRERAHLFVRVVRSPWFFLTFVVVEGVVALESSRNLGTGFLAPLVPAMVALGVGALVSVVARRKGAVIAVAVLVIAASVPSYLAKMALNGPTHQPVVVGVPVLGPVTALDGRSYFDLYVLAGGVADARDPSESAWRIVNAVLVRDVDRFISGTPGPVGVVFAFDEYLVNPNTFTLRELQVEDAVPGVDLLSPSAGQSPADYSAEITRALGSEHAVLLLCTDPAGVIPPQLEQGSVEKAAQGLGFAPYASITLPQHGFLQVWTR
jgi:hypothetical protein